MPVGNDPPDLKRIALVAIGVPLLLGLLVAWFGWTARETKVPHGLPIVVVDQVVPGAKLQPKEYSEDIAKVLPGQFTFRTVPTIDAGDQALRDRSAYAVLTADANGLALHVASGGSPPTADYLRRFFLHDSQNLRDVVPGSSSDPNGTGFASGFVPLVLASMLAGVLSVLLIRGRASRLIGLAIFSVVAGLCGAAVMHGLGSLAGSYLLNAATIALLAVAVSAGVAGLGALLGPAGLGLGVLIVFLIGNPISAAVLTPHSLPPPWGQIGQFLPAGAGVSLLRSVSFYDGADSARSLLVLAGWAAVGGALLLVSRSSARLEETSYAVR